MENITTKLFLQKIQIIPADDIKNRRNPQQEAQSRLFDNLFTTNTIVLARKENFLTTIYLWKEKGHEMKRMQGQKKNKRFMKV